MSDIPAQPSGAPMPGGPPMPDDGPSEEEVRAYLGQMRQAPVEQVVAEVLQGLLNAAQIKLGRRDARLLLDTAVGIVDHSRAHLSEELVSQIDDAVNQLRMAQVEAEQQVAAAPDTEENDLDTAVSSSPAGDTPGATSPPAPGGGSKLWVPGR